MKSFKKFPVYFKSFFSEVPEEKKVEFKSPENTLDKKVFMWGELRRNNKGWKRN